jgi:hypothetical protein
MCYKCDTLQLLKMDIMEILKSDIASGSKLNSMLGLEGLSGDQMEEKLSEIAESPVYMEMMEKNDAVDISRHLRGDVIECTQMIFALMMNNAETKEENTMGFGPIVLSKSMCIVLGSILLMAKKHDDEQTARQIILSCLLMIAMMKEMHSDLFNKVAEDFKNKMKEGGLDGAS